MMRQKVSLGERRNRIKEISIKQSCWTDSDQPDTMSTRAVRSPPAPHEAVRSPPAPHEAVRSQPAHHEAFRQSLSAGSAGSSSHATSNSSQSANSTPVVLDDYDEDEDA